MFKRRPLPTESQGAFTLIAFSVSCLAILYLSSLGEEEDKSPRFNSAKEKADMEADG